MTWASFLPGQTCQALPSTEKERRGESEGGRKEEEEERRRRQRGKQGRQWQAGSWPLRMHALPLSLTGRRMAQWRPPHTSPPLLCLSLEKALLTWEGTGQGGLALSTSDHTTMPVSAPLLSMTHPRQSSCPYLPFSCLLLFLSPLPPCLSLHATIITIQWYVASNFGGQ